MLLVSERQKATYELPEEHIPADVDFIVLQGEYWERSGDDWEAIAEPKKISGKVLDLGKGGTFDARELSVDKYDPLKLVIPRKAAMEAKENLRLMHTEESDEDKAQEAEAQEAEAESSEHEEQDESTSSSEAETSDDADV